MAYAWFIGFAAASLASAAESSVLLAPTILLGLVVTGRRLLRGGSRLVSAMAFAGGCLWAGLSGNPADNRARGLGLDCPAETTASTTLADTMLQVQAAPAWGSGPLQVQTVSAQFKPLGLCRLRNAMERYIRETCPRQHRFLRAVLLGDKRSTEERVEDSFRRLGILHLLVVSGFHVTLVATLVTLAMAIPFHILYSLRLLTPRGMANSSHLLAVACIACVFAYCRMTDFGPATQRSFLVFGVAIMSRTVRVQATFHRKISWVIALQSLLFPHDVFTAGSLLSWAAYLLVTAPTRGESTLLRALAPQAMISLAVAALFGEFSVIGLFTNLLVVPVFSLLMLYACPLLAFGLFLSAAAGILDPAASFILETVHAMALTTYRFSWLFWQFNGMPPFAAMLMLQACALYLLWAFKAEPSTAAAVPAGGPARRQFFPKEFRNND